VKAPDRDPRLEPLAPLAGEWDTEATHRAFPDMVVRGRTSVEWLEGERFLIVRARTEHPDFPDSISVIGGDDEHGLRMHYFDSRGVQRVYETSTEGGAWRMARDAPEFSQRFVGTFVDGGDGIDGRWEMAKDGSDWAEDLVVRYRRRR